MSGKVKLAVIGTGTIGQVHLREYRDHIDKAEVLAVCDVDPLKAAYCARKYGIKKWYTDYTKMLKEEKLDAVDICLPVYLHVDAAIKAAELGVHILCEKPIAPTLEEADAMISVAEKCRVFLMMGFMKRFHPAYKWARKAIIDGEIGRIFAIKAHKSHTGPYSSWYLEKERAGGGCLMDIGTHVIDLFRWFLGEYKWVHCITKIGLKERTIERTFVDPEATKITEVEDYAELVTKFDNETIGELCCLWSPKGYPTWQEHIQIFGDKGLIVIDVRQKKPLTIFRDGGAHQIEGLYCEWEELFKLEEEHFIQAILKQHEPQITGEDGRKALEVVLAAYNASTLKNRVMMADVH